MEIVSTAQVAKGPRLFPWHIGAPKGGSGGPHHKAWALVKGQSDGLHQRAEAGPLLTLLELQGVSSLGRAAVSIGDTTRPGGLQSKQVITHHPVRILRTEHRGQSTDRSEATRKASRSQPSKPDLGEWPRERGRSSQGVRNKLKRGGGNATGTFGSVRSF